MEYKQLEVHKVVEQVEEMATLARFGQDCLKMLGLLSPETRQIIIGELVERDSVYLATGWPSPAMRDLPKGR